MSRVFLRHWTLVRACAFWLLLLAASPFTAPFSTLDLSPAGTSGPAIDAGKTKSANDDVIAAPVLVPAAYRADPGACGLYPPWCSPVRHPSQHTILRV
jgi:hypothetical protein